MVEKLIQQVIEFQVVYLFICGNLLLVPYMRLNNHFVFCIVWAFDTETECWSLMEAKGDIPVYFSFCTYDSLYVCLQKGSSVTVVQSLG